MTIATFLGPSLRALALLVVVGNSAAAAAPDIELASVDHARGVLGAPDEFVERLSAFDRAARMKTDRDVSESEYLAFVALAVREWTGDERERVSAAFATIEPALAALLPSLDEAIMLIKTTGAEEGGAGAYTRGYAVVLSEKILGGSEQALARTLAHEIFHVVSRQKPAWRDAVYATIGFEACGEVEFPATLAARKITNPDAPINEHCIKLGVAGADAWAVPILYSREPRYDPVRGGEFFNYLTLSLLLVDRSDPNGRARPLYRPDGRDAGPALVAMNQVSGFFEQVGRNTDYIIHPEEILASNFELLVLGDGSAPSPEVLERLRDALTAAASAQN